MEEAEAAVAPAYTGGGGGAQPEVISPAFPYYPGMSMAGGTAGMPPSFGAQAQGPEMTPSPMAPTQMTSQAATGAPPEARLGFSTCQHGEVLSAWAA
jgi:hypothetical protein